MSIVFQMDKRTGIKYAYENEAYWDKEKKQSRSKRTLIGKVDPETGEIIPTRPYRKKAEEAPVSAVKPGPVPVTVMNRRFFGATYLLDAIGRNLGVTEDLKSCFPDSYKQLQSLAYFLILEENNALSRFSKWDRLHWHPHGKDILSQRSSELFQSIDEERKMSFFKKQGKRRAENEYWAYDTTSISSYSETLKQVKYGKNKENDRLPQINLALLFGEKSNLPFYYRKLPGNITDVTTVKQLLKEFRVLGYEKVKLVMDRGFYSQANINELFQNRLKFLVSTKIGLGYVQKELDTQRESLKSWTSYNDKYDIHAICQPITWTYEQPRPYKGDVVKEERRCYLHLYYNREKAADDQGRMNRYLSALKSELEQKKEIPEHQKDYAKYFDVTDTPKRARKIVAKDAVIQQATKDYGYFSLLSNDVKDPIEALELYRNKDLVEKAFGNLKERLNMRRALVSSETALNGKLFVEFIALIYLSYIKKRMQEEDLFRKWTLQGLLDELDLVECFEAPGHGKMLGELTKKQADLYQKLGIDPPSLEISGI